MGRKAGRNGEGWQEARRRCRLSEDEVRMTIPAAGEVTIALGPADPENGKAVNVAALMLRKD